MIRGWKWRLRSVSGVGLTLCGLLLGAQVVEAQEPVEQPRQRFEFAAGTWISTGDTRWAHNASSMAGLGNPTSKLTYKDVGTNVIELTGKVWIAPKWFGRLNGGYAGIGGGRLTDDDYGSNGGQRLFSHTNSDLSGDNMWYLNADSGFRVAEYPNHRGWLEIFGGYQFWHTTYQATGLTQVSCDPNAIPGFTCALAPGQSSNQGQTVLTNTTNWHSIRVGASTEYRLTRRLSVLSTLALIPASVLDNKDVHHLRGDLKQDPSFSMVGYGVGADADVGARFMITQNLAANVGYRVYYNRMLSGDLTVHPVVGSSESFPLTQFESLRHGFTASLSLIF
ncbi:MAG: hypothetical protein HY281_04995 [Nitrospirae bacterium]|nr:hypothetical protein [Nitrospirota bacterium]